MSRPDPTAADKSGANFVQSVKAIGWAFFGLRRASGSQQDARLNPLYIVAAGFIGVLVFVAALMVAVHWVTA